MRTKKKEQSIAIKTGRKVEPSKAHWKIDWVAEPELKSDKKPKESPEIKSGSKLKPPKAQYKIPVVEPEIPKPTLNEYQMIRLLIDFLGTYEATES